MAFLGKGAMAFWNDVTADGEADFNHWHVFEHIPERVGVPGFLRGRGARRKAKGKINLRRWGLFRSRIGPLAEHIGH